VPASGDAVARFHNEHQRRYGYHHPSREIELVTLRLRAKLRTSSLHGNIPARAVGKQPVLRSSAARVKHLEKARIVFEKSEATPIFERSQLPENHVIKGPAIITEYGATTVIPPGKKFHLDHAENLVIEISRKV
jgi:N-methylhydantoinase A